MSWCSQNFFVQMVSCTCVAHVFIGTIWWFLNRSRAICLADPFISSFKYFCNWGESLWSYNILKMVVFYCITVDWIKSWINVLNTEMWFHLNYLEVFLRSLVLLELMKASKMTNINWKTQGFETHRHTKQSVFVRQKTPFYIELCLSCASGYMVLFMQSGLFVAIDVVHLDVGQLF